MGEAQPLRQNRDPHSCRAGFTTLELLLVLFIIALIAAVLLPALARSREASRRTTCQSNLKQLGIVLKMYAQESEGEYYPPTQKWHLNGTPTLAWLRGSLLFPEYFADLNVSVCPSDSRAREFVGSLDFDFGAYVTAAWKNQVSPTCWDALLSLGISYTYLGYAVASSSQLKDVVLSRVLIAMDESVSGNAVFISAADMHAQGCMRKLFASYGRLGELDIPGDPQYQAGHGQRDDHGQPLPAGYRRLRNGVERFFVRDINSPAQTARAASEIPLVFDTWAANTPLFGGAKRFNHIPGGSNVLYLDGHVDFVPLGSKPPVSDSPPGTFGMNLSQIMAVVSGSD